MAEIPAVAAARVAISQNDARTSRLLQEENRQQLDLRRQNGIARRVREQQGLQSLDRRRLETELNDLRTVEENSRFIEEQERLRNSEIRDQRSLVRLIDADEALAQARALDFEAGVPRPEPLTPFPSPDEGQPLREFQPPPETVVPIVGQATPEDQQPAPTPEFPEFPAAGIAETGAFPIPEGPAFSSQEVFDLQERERGQRLAERRDGEVDQRVQQEIDLRLAEDQIATTPANPGLPRGAIVDILG